MVFEALKAADILKKEGVDVRVINMHSIKPIDKEVIIRSAIETGCIKY
jgi:transketolase